MKIKFRKVWGMIWSLATDSSLRALIYFILKALKGKKEYKDHSIIDRPYVTEIRVYWRKP